MIKTRIAPSPTGRLHIGNARAALFSYIIAKQKGGRFVVRIEDTDKQRSKKEYEDDIFASLSWLGLEWDELSRQSERRNIHERHIKKLLDEGKAYYCSHSAQETRGAVHFCDKRDKAQTNHESRIMNQGVIRFKTLRSREVVFNDTIRGILTFKTDEIGDFSIAKNAQEPLFILAVTIDDSDMKITHVIRGEDHISNVPKQILLQEALGLSQPRYAHLPIILGPDKSKLSKRHGATSISEFRKKGYLPEALVNAMAFLGWNPGDNREFFTLEGLMKEFSLERVKKGGAIFNLVKLDAINQHYIKTLSPDIIAQHAKRFLVERYGSNTIDRCKNIEDAIALEQGRAKTLIELVDGLDFVFDRIAFNPALLAWKDQTALDVRAILQEILQAIKKMSAEKFSPENLKDAFFALIEKRGGDKGSVLWPMRVALSGKSASPGPFEIASVLGKKETIKRINEAIQQLNT